MASLFNALSTAVPLSYVIQALNSVMAALQGGAIDLTVSQAWTPLVYSNTWTDYGSGWAPGAWFKDPFDVVHLRGLVARSGAPAGGEVVATLPVGARPPYNELFIVHNNGGWSRVDVAPSGIVAWNSGTGTPNAYTQLSGLSFRTS